MKASSSRAASNSALRGRAANSEKVEVIVGPSGMVGRAQARPPRPRSIGSCLVGRDRLFEILAFFASRGAKLRQRCKLFLRLVHVACLHEELAKIFTRSLV